VTGAEKRLDGITKRHTHAIDDMLKNKEAELIEVCADMTGPPPAPVKDHGRAGRDLKAAIGSAVVLLAAIGLSLFFCKPAFMFMVAAAVCVAIWELHKGLLAKAIDIPEQPLMLGGIVMVVVAYLW